MSQPPVQIGPVLYYSSPRPRGKLRLPAQGRIALLPNPNCVIVQEWLETKTELIVAMIFAGLSLLVMPLMWFIEERRHFRHDFASDPLWSSLVVLIIVSVLIGGIVVMLMVINNTWMRTTLEARRDSVILIVSSPFGRHRFEWNASDVEGVLLESTTTYMHRNHLGQLNILISRHPPVKLFADQAYHDLEPVAAALTKTLNLPPASHC